MVAPLNPLEFEKFCRGLTIESRDAGLVPFRFNAAQVIAVREIAKALQQDKRVIKMLKCRQIGGSTIGLAFDMYWCKKHPGIHGVLATDTESNREQFRTTLDAMLGQDAKREGDIIRHNREHLVFPNRSRLIYQVVGVRENGMLGRGKGLNYCHATECSSWGSRESYESLMSSFSQKHPNRFYFFESTARGFNMWYDMWNEAKKARSQAAIFLTWWHTPELFSFPRGTNEWRVYGQGEPTGEEKEWIRAVKLIYKHEISTAQLAWWRWMIEDQGRNPEAMYEDFPPTEELAFQMTGSQFFSTESLTRLMAKSKRAKPKGYNYSFGGEYKALTRRPCRDSYPQLLVWEPPQGGAYYTIGADPCGGTGGGTGDDAVIEVLRCYGDGVEQVAEFRTPGIPGYCFAWILASLAAEYQPCVVNLEINGAGISVADELSRLEFAGSFYLYRRSDSLGGGGFLHWRTTNENKRWVMEHLRTCVERDMIEIRSEEAVSQMRKIEQTGIYVGTTSARTGDDCVMAIALAAEAWSKNYLDMLKGMNAWKPKRDDKGRIAEENVANVVTRQVRDLLDGAGLIPAAPSQEAAYGEAFFAGASDEEDF